MIDTETLADIVATYKKHGWILRRVLLSTKTKANVDGSLDLSDVRIVDSEIDTAWFSRPSKPGGVAWEIRYLGDTPFALVENIDENAADFEGRLRTVEARLFESITAKRSA